MKSKKIIKNDVTQALKNKKWYNPNEFNSLDSSICYIVTLISFYILSLIMPYILTPLVKVGIIRDYFLLQIVSIIISQGVIFLIAFSFFKIKKVDMFSGGGYHTKTNNIDLCMAIMLVLGVILCFTPMHQEFYEYMQKIFGNLNLEISKEIIEKSNPYYILLYSYIVVPLAPAICEELLFRGVILRGYQERGYVFSIIISSIMFSFMHGSVARTILQFLVGLTIAIVVTITKNHIYGCVMHFVANVTPTLLGVIAGIFELKTKNITYVFSGAYLIFGVVFLLIASYYFIKKAIAKSSGNKKAEYIDGEPVTCVTTFSRISSYGLGNDGETSYYKVFGYNEDIKNIKETQNSMYYYKDSFVFFNKNKKGIVPIILASLGIVFAVVLMFI